MKRRTLLDRICTPEFAVGVARARTALDKTDAAYARGRRAGLEEAARIAEEPSDWLPTTYQVRIATRIRALAAPEKGGTDRG